MVADFSYDVFLSHSAKDKAVVREVAERLRSDGVRVWFDEWEIHAGDSIAAKIEEGLEHSRVLVLCMSASAFGSDWAQLEASTFRFRDPLNKERRFIPLRLDSAPIQGSLVAQFVYIDWRAEMHEQEYTKLLEVCRMPSKAYTEEARTVGEQISEKNIQLDCRGFVYSYAFSPDGKRALSGGEDTTMRLWDVETGRCLKVFNGHRSGVWTVAWSSDQRHAISGSDDSVVRLWDVETGRCLQLLRGHSGAVKCAVLTTDQSHALSSSEDLTVRLWDLHSGRCLRVLEGHTREVWSVESSADGRRALTGADDNSIRAWDLATGDCVRVLEGHTSYVWRALWSIDQRLALSCSIDRTIRLWDLETGGCLRVLEGHSSEIRSVAWSADQRHAVSGSLDRTIRLWDVETGSCLRVFRGHASGVRNVAWSTDQRHAFSGDENGCIRVWDLSEYIIEEQALEATTLALPSASAQVQYINAKVLLIGESGAGKTGLTERLARNRPPLGEPSTSGTWSTQWPLNDLPQGAGWEREVWLWDFGGQADQRLIHQLYLDRTALVLLLFNADQEIVLPGLREWQQALARSVPQKARTFLVAGRTDVGFRFDREKIRAFAHENGYDYFETSAQTGSGIPELRKAILDKIPWDELTPHNSPALFKQLKDEILKLRDEGMVLTNFKALESILRHRLPPSVRFEDVQLETVVSLLDGPGLVKELDFGTYILLRPEWINVYAQAVIRTLRAVDSGLGCLPVRSIAEGKLIFQTKQADREEAQEKRLARAEEIVVLQAMEQMLLERRLCLTQDGDLVFPSYCGLERPTGPVPPRYFVSYTIRGFLDDIYATLVVKLAHCGAFVLKQLWRDAADFETLVDRIVVGIKLVRKDDGRGELLAHNAHGLTEQEQVIFANYIHGHLREKATEEVTRLRFYFCPHCKEHEPVMNRELAMERLEKNGEKAEIRCQRCDEFIPLWDNLEKRFASEELKKKVEALRDHERSSLDSRRLGKLLVHEVSARITSANQKCHEIPGEEDEGIDLVAEFTDDGGRGTGKHMYLQLKSGNSHLRPRGSGEVFRIKKQNWVKQWTSQDGPVMLVIGTFSDEPDRGWSEKKAFSEVRWMEISELLKRASDNGKKPVKQIVFEGERLDVMSVRRWRDKVLGTPGNETARSKR